MMKLELNKLEEKCDDTCENCGEDKKQIYYLKGTYDILDFMLCESCFNELKRKLNKLKI